jgi:hypothetical protein
VSAKVAFERNTGARGRGRQPAASRHEATRERARVAFDCCNGGFDSERDLPGLLPNNRPPLGVGSDAGAR